MFIINKNKIIEDYGSLAEFSRKERISLAVMQGLEKKTSPSFKGGSDSFKAYKELQRMGYITKEKEIA